MASKTFTATSFTCDRCGRAEVTDLADPASSTPWAFATSSEYMSGVPIIPTPEGAHQVDMCPACAADLKRWWSTPRIPTIEVPTLPKAKAGKSQDAL